MGLQDALLATTHEKVIAPLCTNPTNANRNTILADVEERFACRIVSKLNQFDLVALKQNLKNS